MTTGPNGGPGPEDVAQALREGRPPSELLAEEPPQHEPAPATGGPGQDHAGSAGGQGGGGQ